MSKPRARSCCSIELGETHDFLKGLVHRLWIGDMLIGPTPVQELDIELGGGQWVISSLGHSREVDRGIERLVAIVTLESIAPRRIPQQLRDRIVNIGEELGQVDPSHDQVIRRLGAEPGGEGVTQYLRV